MLAATVSAAVFAVPANELSAGTIRHDYATSLYLDFAANAGAFSAGAKNIAVYRTDGTLGGTISLMPNLSGYADFISGTKGNGGAGLIGAQFLATAQHVGASDPDKSTVKFFTKTSNEISSYKTAGYKQHYEDQELVRLSKLVTEATYNPVASASFVNSALSKKLPLYRLGTGAPYVAKAGGGVSSISTGGKPLGGLIVFTPGGISVKNGNIAYEADFYRDSKLPLSIGAESGDSGSPVYAYNEASGCFEYVGAVTHAYTNVGYGAYLQARINSEAWQNEMAAFNSDGISLEEAGDVISWGASALSRGNETWAFHGITNGNSLVDTRGIVWNNAGTGTQEIRLAQDIDLGAGSVTVNSGKFLLSSDVEGTTNFNSAGFLINAGATLTTNFSGAAGTEWRKVGEGNLVIQGSGNHEITLNVGGGVQRFDENLNPLYLGEVRLDREGGYAAKTIRLSAGIAKIVLMREGQISGADAFTFGIGGGLLNLNGQSLSWDKINHTDSGAKIGNFKLDDATSTPADSVFTFTGSGTFKGGFLDGNADSYSYDAEKKTWSQNGGGAASGTLKVVYDAADSASTWKLAGTSENSGGFEVRSGTLILQGANTTHASYSDSGDWTYAVLESAGGVTVNDGATFRLADHALMTADITVRDGGTFEMTDVVKAASESVCGGQREDVSNLVGLRGNVSLGTSATMKVSTTTANVALRYDGAISGAGNFEKTGAGTLVLSGANTFSGTKTVSAGTLEFSSLAAMGTISDDASKWKIGADAALLVNGEGAAALEKISGESSGVLALGADVAEALDLSGHQKLFIGAAAGKTINYGASNLELAVNSDNQWLLGGGGGTLKVLSKLTGTGTLVVGNEVSSGTVFLANTSNDFSGKIVLGGNNNFLDYDDPAALGNAKFEIQYGNAMGFGDGTNKNMLKALNDASTGILALSKNSSAIIDFSSKTIALGAVAGETVRFTGTLTPHTDGYRFGGAGTLIVDTALSGASALSIDAQGMRGGKIIFAQENSGFTGAVTIGAKLIDNSEIPDNGTITVGFENGKALANASSVTLKKGATLDIAGANVRLKNVAVESGAAVKNLGSERGTFTAIQNGDATWAGGALGGSDSAAIDFVKQGAGTLTLGANNNFKGTVSIEAGTLKAAGGNSSSNSSFGVASAGNTIYIGENGTLDLTLTGSYGTKNFSDAKIHQTITGTGTVAVRVNQARYDYTVFGPIRDYHLSEVTTVLFSQTEAFDGTVRVEGNSRLLVGKNLNGASNLDALKNATVEVTSGSQVRVTNTVNASNSDLVSAYANFVLNGSGFAGSDGRRYWENSNGGGVYSRFAVDSGKKLGALSVDCGSTVYGNVTLATDATVASWNYGNGKDGAIYGAILGGAERTLTVAGDRGLSFKADAASNYGNLKIQNANGADGFALRVSGGAYRSTTSTALGGGTVSLNAGLRLQFDNSGSAGKNIVYTYGNAFSLGDKAELFSARNTTRLTGGVALAGTAATFSTSNDSVLRLEGGITGALGTTANITAGSRIELGGNAANTLDNFEGTFAAGAGTQLTLLKSAAREVNGISFSSAKISFTDSFTLSLEGSGQFMLGSIVGSASAEKGLSTLDLHYDFTSGTAGSSLSLGNLTADALNIFIDLDSAGTLAKGSYKLLSGAGATALSEGNYSLANNSGNRLSLKLENGALVLTVDADGRLVWRHQDGNTAWDTTSKHWNSEKSGDVAFAAGDSVIFDKTGVASGNSATSPESITLSARHEVGTVLARDAFYEISGTGGLTGTNAALVVLLGGTLNLANTGGNVFAKGASVQEGGTLRLSAAGTLTDTALSLKSTGTLSLEAAGAFAGTTTVVFDGGMLKYGTANAGDISAFLRAGTDVVNLDLNGNAGIVLSDLSALSETKNARLTLSNSAADAASITLGSATNAYETAAGSAIEVGAGISATHFAKGTLGTLSGAGDYTFDGSAGALAISDMSDFAGTAAIINASKDNKLSVEKKSAGTRWKISGNWSGGNVDFNDFAADNAIITLVNALSSWIAQGKTYMQDFILESDEVGAFGIKLTNGYSSTTTTFSGKFTGDGLFLVDRTKTGTKVTDKIKFTGDLSGFEGGFKSVGTTAFGFIFSDNDGATTYANNDAALGTGTITNSGSVELNFAAARGVANAFDGSGTVTKTGAGALALSGDWANFSGTLTVASGNGGLTLAGTDQHFGGAGTYSIGDTLRVTGKATFDAGATLSFGSLEVARGASLSMGAGITLAAKNDTAEAGRLSAGSRLSHSAIVGADDGSSRLSDAVATFAGTPGDSSASGFSLKSLTLENSAVVVQSGASLTLQNVVFSSGTTARIESGSKLVASSEILLTAAASALELVIGEAQRGAAGTPLITAENGGKVKVSGDANVYVDISALALTLSDGAQLSLKIAAESALEFNDRNARVGWWDKESRWKDTDYAFAYNADSGMLTLSIPEPSVFGLFAGALALALAGTRRRRKK